MDPLGLVTRRGAASPEDLSPGWRAGRMRLEFRYERPEGRLYPGANWFRPGKLTLRWRAEVVRRPRKTPGKILTCQLSVEHGGLKRPPVKPPTPARRGDGNQQAGPHALLGRARVRKQSGWTLPQPVGRRRPGRRQTTDYARRGLFGSASGRGFDSRRLQFSGVSAMTRLVSRPQRTACRLRGRAETGNRPTCKRSSIGKPAYLAGRGTC